MKKSITSICVFCGSSASPDPAFTDGARRMGELLAERGITLVYGAGKSGMMGALAHGALEKCGVVIGVTHKHEADHWSFQEGLERVEVLETLQQRKARMIELADAIVVLPGGFGTLDEFSEMLAWRQIGLHDKPIALLNIKGYFDGLLTWVQRAAQEQYIRPGDMQLFFVEEDPERLLNRLRQK
mgnify:CR=1 FL=1|jgi:uncharacterized protein (TIGR00730 family)